MGHDRERLKIYIQAAGLLLLGLYSMICTHFHRYFAKIHIVIPNIGLPLFIGEMIFIFSILLLIILWKISAIKFNKWHYFLFSGVGFILFKAISGYTQWGGLALRNAALFYYPLFAVMAYYFYNKKLFTQKTIIIVIGIFLLNRFTGGFYDYFIFTYLCLLLFLFSKLPNSWDKYVGLAVVFITLPYNFLFGSTRTIMISNFFAFSYIDLMYFFVFLRIRKYVKFGLSLSALLIFSVCILHYADKNAIASLSSPKRIISDYQNMDKIYKECAPNFKFTNVGETKLFKKESASLAELIPSKWREEIFKKNRQLQSSSSFPEKETAQSEAVKLPSLEKETAQSEAVKLPSLEKETAQSEAVKLPSLEKETAQSEAVKLSSPPEKSTPPLPPQREYRNLIGANNNIIWRLLFWTDVFEELVKDKKFLGMDFGKPLRPKRLEVVGWGAESMRMGWEEPHNSYIHILYRSGIIGIVVIMWLIAGVILMTRKIIHTASFSGVFLIAIVIYWMVVPNFGVILELPYYAIPFWSLFGLIYAYINHKVYNLD